MTYCTEPGGFKTKKHTDKNGYNYETVTNDPYGLRIYTLKNGLKVYLSVNKDAPRIQTYIAVKAGSTYDPADNTGLAHYLEHMMFKGTPKIGTVNWDEEKVLIQQISDLYEEHKAEQDTEKKKEIYSKIDSISQLAAQYVAPSEYPELVKSIGATGTNAYTSNERTVYINNIPSNELEKWLEIEGERFFNPVLRVFHTELETVYEEFNMGQDNDYRKTYYTLLENMFPNHPYGTQTTIGKAEHLKNPSMEKILNYQHTYYVPNNIAICMSGDLDPANTIKLINKYFGSQPSKDVPHKELPKESPITDSAIYEVYGPQAELLYMAFRFNGVNTHHEKMVTLIDYMLTNSKAGLIDLNLNQQQKVLRAGCGPLFMKDYGMHYFFGMPRQGQSLDEVRELLLGEIDKIKKGDFDDWLMEACINNMKLDRLKGIESNERAHLFAEAFTNKIEWEDYLKFNDELSSITKDEIIEFANKMYSNNYVAVYKKTGIDTTVVKIEKPQITPVNLNRDNKSEFAKAIEQKETERIQPVFADFSVIQHNEIAPGVPFNYIKNETNELFNLVYIIDMGSRHDQKLALAVNYLPYLGTDKYTAAELNQELFKYGLSFGVSTGAERSYVSVSGLEANIDKGIELLEHIIANVQPDSESYTKYIEGIAKERADSKLDKGNIIQGLMNYGKYGSKSPFTNIISQTELENINPAELTEKVKQITAYEHRIFYYGQMESTDILLKLKEKHLLANQLKSIPEPLVYNELEINTPKVYFVNYDMVQTQFIFLSKGEKRNNELLPAIQLFNEFYGGGLSSIVFQEIRESRALAYSAYSVYSTPANLNESHYNYSFVATQADKLQVASQAMKALLSEVPQADKQFAVSKDAIMKKIETGRIIKDDIFWTWLNAKKVNIDYDIRKNVYDYVSSATIGDFKSFFNSNIKDKPYAFLVIGKRDMLDMEVLKSIGEFKELTLTDVFGY